MEDAQLVRSEGCVATATYSFSNLVGCKYTAEVNNFHMISLDTNRISREEACLPSFDVVICWLKSLAIYFGEDT